MTMVDVYVIIYLLGMSSLPSFCFYKGAKFKELDATDVILFIGLMLLWPLIYSVEGIVFCWDKIEDYHLRRQDRLLNKIESLKTVEWWE